MRTITNTYDVYTYSELSAEAKENVKQWLLDDDLRPQLFEEDILNYCSELFPRSDIKVQFDLGYSQGDGLNIYGTFNILDFLDKWQASDKGKRTITFYAEYQEEIELEYNNYYCYSCKDDKQAECAAEELIDLLEYNDIKNVNEALIYKFFNDLFEYLANFDLEWEEAGYEYFYGMSEEEAEETCDANCYEFTIDGKIA